ncbi:MAG: aspartate aminotransferase family protein [Nitrospirae bacterium]|nr:aspartate aminotransferase family protein [Nitrospirota bacterium]
MAVKKYRGVPYHLWNPFTVMDEFLPLLGIGPVVVTRGEGPYIFNERGKRFINGMSSLWNLAIGHGREELVEAATEQMRKLAYASCFRQVHPKAIELAGKLVEITSGNFEHVFLSSNGSDAVEAALMMTRQYHRQSPDMKDHSRYKIISLRGSYHGVSYGAISTAGLESNKAKFGPLNPGFVQIEPPYCYRCPYGKSGYPECGLECAAALEKTIESEGPQTVAAFIMEPIMGVLGIIEPPEEYYNRVGEICRRHGLLFIVDEVTTGFGRTGKLFISEDWGIKPDILCLGKAISSGYLPLAATLATDEIYQRFDGEGNQFAYGSTASGHPVCAAVGLKNIDIIINEKIPENAARVGAYLKSRLKDMISRRKIIGDVRGRGLMIGIELVKDREQKVPLDKKDTFNIVVDTAILGLLVYCSDNVLGLFPPLIIDKDIADKIVEILDRSLETGIAAEIARKARLVKEFTASKLS